MNILDALTRDSFNAIINLRRVAQATPAEAMALHHHTRDSVDRMMGRALASGVPQTDVYAAVYALAALADSVATRGKGVLAAYWREHLLQMHYFGPNETNAQDGFFDRLEQAKNSGRGGVLHVYATCLALGFRGRLRSADAERTQTQLQTLVAPSTWKQGISPLFAAIRPRRLWQQPLWISLAALLLCMALYTILGAAMRSDAASVAATIEALLSTN